MKSTKLPQVWEQWRHILSLPPPTSKILSSPYFFQNNNYFEKYSDNEKSNLNILGWIMFNMMNFTINFISIFVTNNLCIYAHSLNFLFIGISLLSYSLFGKKHHTKWHIDSFVWPLSICMQQQSYKSFLNISVYVYTIVLLYKVSSV